MKTTENKQIQLDEAVRVLSAGCRTFAIGGNCLHRVPHAFIREIARRDDLKLHVVKTAGAYDIDLLCLAGIVVSVSAGFVGYETEFGLARHYRRAVEEGRTEAREHACYTIITAFRAAAYGLPFLPVRALKGSDLTTARRFELVRDPYGGEEFPAIPAIVPDLAVLHVQYADHRGNGVILGPKNEDLIMARAARKVVLTAEKIVPTAELPVEPDHVDLPSVLVDAVVESPGGAWPGSCHPFYGIDGDGVQALQNLDGPADLRDYLRDVSWR